MSWFDYFTWPRKAISNIEADVSGLRLWARSAPTLEDLNALEARMSALEDQTRAELSDAIAGALGAYDAKVAELAAVAAERDQLRSALETADADKAAAVEAAVAADDEGDAAFNAEQVEKLRRLQPAVDEPAPEPPVDEPA